MQFALLGGNIVMYHLVIWSCNVLIIAEPLYRIDHYRGQRIVNRIVNRIRGHSVITTPAGRSGRSTHIFYKQWKYHSVKILSYK